MNKKVLMVNPPLMPGRAHIDYPPFSLLGVVSNAAVLRESGFSVAIADAFSLQSSDVYGHGDDRLIGAPIDNVLNSCEMDTPDAVVVSVPPFMLPHVRTGHAASLFASIRSQFAGARIVAADCNFSGMHYIGYDARKFMTAYPQVDAVVKYECEACLAHVLSNEAGGGKVVVECRADEISPDELPFPAWDLISLDDYFSFLGKYLAAFNAGDPARRPRTLPAVTSRGCPFKCMFCTSNPGQSTQRFNANSPEYVKKLLSVYVKQYGVGEIVFLDCIPNLDRERFRAILEIVKSMRLRCSFPNGLRADCIEYDHLKLLKELASEVKISAETGSQRIMSRLKKQLPIEDVEKVAGWCAELKIPLNIHYMIGIPHETPVEANETLLHALKMKEKHGAKPLVQYLVPIPGSEAHTLCSQMGLLDNFEPLHIYSYFTEKPALDFPDFPAAKLADMMLCFKKRISDTHISKVIINLTYLCSNDCVFCAVGDRERKHGDFKRFTEFLIQHREAGVDAVDFDGGEPTLFPHFLRIVAVAKELGYTRINVTTNARRLADRGFASRFLLSGITSVLVSLHGHTRELHEAHTRTEGGFSETLRGIRHIVELKPERIRFAVNTTLTPNNVPHLSDFAAFARDLGAQGVNLQFITPHGAARQFMEYNIESMIEIVRDVAAEYKDAIDIQIINLPPCLSRRITGVLDPETGKYSRVMVFADCPPMNLGEYLDQRREKRSECAACEAASACAGYYVFARG